MTEPISQTTIQDARVAGRLQGHIDVMEITNDYRKDVVIETMRDAIAAIELLRRRVAELEEYRYDLAE